MKVYLRRFYVVSFILFGIGATLIVAFPDASLVALTLLVPVVLVGAAWSTVYLAYVYRRQPIPRSRFYLMLLETFVALLTLGGWVAYLSVARVLERAYAAGDVDFMIPAPPPSISSPISALIVVIVFGAPIRYALEVRSIRRRSGYRAPEDDDITSNGQ